MEFLITQFYPSVFVSRVTITTINCRVFLSLQKETQHPTISLLPQALGLLTIPGISYKQSHRAGAPVSHSFTSRMISGSIHTEPCIRAAFPFYCQIRWKAGLFLFWAVIVILLYIFVQKTCFHFSLVYTTVGIPGPCARSWMAV